MPLQPEHSKGTRLPCVRWKAGWMMAFSKPSQRKTICPRRLSLCLRKKVSSYGGSPRLRRLTVRSITPNQALLGQLDLRGVIVTAPGTDVDFISRFFAPKFGIPEDPVTGSVHCELAPYWTNKLGKNNRKRRRSTLCYKSPMQFLDDWIIARQYEKTGSMKPARWKTENRGQFKFANRNYPATPNEGEN